MPDPKWITDGFVLYPKNPLEGYVVPTAVRSRLADPFATSADLGDDEPDAENNGVKWQTAPNPDNAKDAINYLMLFKKRKHSDRIVEDLETRPLEFFKAKDILRAANLQPLPVDDPNVKHVLDEIDNGVALPPVYLTRGDLKTGVPATIADGYHRTSAAYHRGPSTEVAAQIDRP